MAWHENELSELRWKTVSVGSIRNQCCKAEDSASDLVTRILDIKAE